MQLEKTDLVRFELTVYSLGGCRPIQARLQVHLKLIKKEGGHRDLNQS